MWRPRLGAVRPERLDEHLALLDQVYRELAHTRPPGLRYLSLRLADGHRFIDVVIGPRLPAPLPLLPAFVRYRTGFDERCEDFEMSEVSVSGSYGMGE
ncbi:hypothetical protein [Micromonospora maris]|uniref:Uncharacterized protein n=1 Tax=Micromonospora maris TaxID=1003110 RepID=A0A9X0I973_9ACTN|nr:hypothetical protein [Micromonospora maris]AEB44023.1 hypothetical protein VAB18032_14555 [Micromonospora maris AB-18-032]KUJ49253.1 hypothetical protein ADL17_09960 [Micromonospora maris]